MSSPFIWAGNYAKSLKSWLNLNDQVYIVNGSADPTSVAQNGPAGSIYQRTNGSVYVKQDAGTTTNWTILSTGGGGGVAVSPEVIADPSILAISGTTFPSNIAYGNLIVVGTTAFYIGGMISGNNAAATDTPTNKIWSANLLSNPVSFSDTGNTLPAASYGGVIFRVGTQLIYAGGFTSSGTTGSTNVVWTASASSPSVWSNSGNTLPTNKGKAVGAIIGSKLFLISGHGGPGTSIFSASTASPTVWTTEATAFPSQRIEAQIAVIDNQVLVYGGYDSGGTSSNQIFTSNVNAPTVFTQTGTIPAARDSQDLYIIDNGIFLTGGENVSGQSGSASTTVYRASVSSPQSFSTYSTSLPTAVAGQRSFLYNGILYIVGGGTANEGTPTNNIQVSSYSIATNTPTYSGINSLIGNPTFDNGGQQLIKTTFEKFGYAPWLYDVTKPV